jgi:hypothetical protein
MRGHAQHLGHRLTVRAGWIARCSLAAIVVSLIAGRAQADSVHTSTESGFARIEFTLDPAGHAKAAMSDGVLTVTFDRKVAIDPNAIMQGLSTYISAARVDADGATFRLALAQSARLHTSVSGGKIAFDLAPQTYTGTPADLPPPPPKGPSAVDVAVLPALTLRAGAYSNFTRLVFDWPKNVPYSMFPGAGHVTIRFEAMARPDFASFEHVSPPWVKEAGWKVENRGTVLEFDTDASSGFHDFRDGNKIVLDILAPKSDANAYNPPGIAKGEKPKITKIASSASGTTSAQAQAIADAATKLKGNSQPTPSAATQQQPAAAKPTTSAPAQTVAAATTQAAANTPAAPNAAAANATPPAANSAQAQRTHEGAIVSIAGAAQHPAAVFVRNMTAWVVVDDAPPIDPVQLKTALGDFPASVDVASGNGVTVLRIGLKQPEQISARADGSNLTVILSPHISQTATAITFVRDDDDPKHPALSTLLPGVTHVVPLIDPTAGDALVAVPGNLGRASLDPRSYAEFGVLQTAAGLVLMPLTDDLSEKVVQSHVIVSRPQGLQLTAPAMAVADSPSALASPTDGPAYLDLASWGHTTRGGFLVTERRLREKAAILQPEEANPARLALARFYLGNGYAAEALGLVNLVQASDPSLQSDPAIQTMRAAADYMMGRYHDAHNDIASEAFDSDRHAAFWRGLTEATLENWDGARKALQMADPVVRRYPPEWQARAKIAEANVALAAGGIEAADAALGKLPPNLPKDLMLDAQLVRALLYSQEGRNRDAVSLFDAIEASGNEHAAAEAIYDRVETGLVAGNLSQDQAIALLEQLRFRWRGDTLELKTLRKLGALYVAKQRWHEGFRILRLAALSFPNEDLARQAQDDMRDNFEALFLKGKADALPPITALSLFYDFIDLTPIGPDGDEMIRRMSDRLVAVDLLGPAAQLLNYQVTKRLDGIARAQVATRLAMIELMDHKPKDALEALRSTRIAGLPDDVNHERTLLESRALAALKQWDQALDMIAVDDQPDSRHLRADIYWESGNWAVAGQKTEDLLGTRWSDAAPLTVEERHDVMRAAISYSLAGDEIDLDRLRGHFAAKMQTSPDASAFAVVSQNIDTQGTAFRDQAGQIASIDTLESFMQDFRKHYENPRATN